VSTRPRRRRSRRAPSLGERLRLFLPARSWRLQLVGAAIGLCIALFSAQSLASAREGANVYQIRPGDTLLTIAAATGMSIDRLVGLNGITNPDVIMAGDSLQLDGTGAPAAPAPTAAAGASSASAAASNASATSPGVRYTVQTGDTLWDIARRSGTSVENLLKLNNLDNADQLTVGQQLAVPATPAPQAAMPGVQN
jgi:LysM repeat protein